MNTVEYWTVFLYGATAGVLLVNIIHTLINEHDRRNR